MTDQASAPTASCRTQDAFDRLTSELAHLSGEGRTEIAKRIEAAREEGDLKENGGYHAAKEEQGKMEARIRQVTQLLEHSTVGETPADDGTLEPGMLVTGQMLGNRGTLRPAHRRTKGGPGPAVLPETPPVCPASVGSRETRRRRPDEDQQGSEPTHRAVDLNRWQPRFATFRHTARCSRSARIPTSPNSR